MVIGNKSLALAASLLALQKSVELPLERLDPPRRAAVLMAILALVITGITLVACVMIYGRWVRRLARHEHGPTTHTTHIENKRLRDALQPILPEGQTSETTIAKRSNDETVAGS